MNKFERHYFILNLIKDNVIRTQGEITQKLREAGADVTQATVSRDIKELRLIKGHDAAGNYRYVSSEHRDTSKQAFAHYREIFSRYATSVEYALNDVVVKCMAGMASSVCVAIDAMYNDMMLGTIAGDDTILIIAENPEKAEIMCARLQQIFSKKD